jgi:hypothetical protein
MRLTLAAKSPNSFSENETLQHNHFSKSDFEVSKSHLRGESNVCYMTGKYLNWSGRCRPQDTVSFALNPLGLQSQKRNTLAQLLPEVWLLERATYVLGLTNTCTGLYLVFVLNYYPRISYSYFLTRISYQMGAARGQGL